MHILIEKNARRLTLSHTDLPGGNLSFPIALGKCPAGRKEKEGDGKTPEGEYFVCLKKMGKYGPSLGISYPNTQDALLSGADEHLLSLIRDAEAQKCRPPWGSFMGGEIYIHAGGTESDWTAGCIALSEADAQRLYDLCPEGTPVTIVP